MHCSHQPEVNKYLIRIDKCKKTIIFRMKKILFLLLLMPVLNSLQSCNQTSPEDALMRSVINSNILFGFAADPWQREFEQPGVKLTDANTGASAPMKRKEIWEYKSANIEDAYKKVKNIGKNDDNSEMISASLALFEYVLPVINNEYKELASLYDSQASADKIIALEQQISTKYNAGFNAKHQSLVEAGKKFAAKHKIRVQWDVNTSPE